MGKISLRFIFAGLLLLAGAVCGHARIVPAENIGVTDANVRMWFVRERQIWMEYEEYRLLPLRQIGRYNEFYESSMGPRIVFTTDAAVRDFSLLEIEPGGIPLRRGSYSVRRVRYALPELTPDEPFVTRWMSWLGEGDTDHGISFTDESGAARRFALSFNRAYFLIELVEF